MIRPDSLVGKMIDEFRLDEFIAMGGMGIVYKAHDTTLNRKVALKLISKTEDVTPSMAEARRRLIKEARAAAGLVHDNIVTIFSYGETDAFQYIAMEYVRGKTLEEVLVERGLLGLQEAIPIFNQILMALEVAHQQEIVHRDIKPSNIMITPGGRIKVMDFGIARIGSSSTTVTGMIMGTPEYMAPEQIRGGKTDTRSDIFAVGTLLYVVLTGAKPFEAETITGLMYKILEDDPTPPEALNKNIPVDVVRIIAKAMSKDPADRFQSPEEMRQALLSPVRHTGAGTEATVIRPPDSRAIQSEPSVADTRVAPEPRQPMSPAPRPAIKAPRPVQQYVLGAVVLTALCGLAFLAWEPLTGLFVKQDKRDTQVKTDTTRVRPEARDSQVKTGTPAQADARILNLEKTLLNDRSNALVKSQLADLYFDKGRFADAARLYEELNQTGKSKTTSERLLNIYKSMNRVDEALAAYIDLLNLSGDRQTFDEFSAYLKKHKPGDNSEKFVQTHLPQIPKAFKWVLLVQTTPPGAEVFVNGVSKGNSPVSVSGIAAGTVKVRAAQEGYRSEEKDVEVLAGKEFRADLLLPSTLQGSSGQPARVEGDKGETPVVQSDVKPPLALLPPPVSPLSPDTKRRKPVLVDDEPAASSGTRMYAVQLGSFNDKESAEALRQNLGRKGYSIIVSSVVSPTGGMKYVVRSMPVDSPNKALKLADQLKRHTKTRPTVVPVNPAGGDTR